MKKLIFTTGELAKLCHTTKATLRHYNQIGLLKPDKIEENGYHYYSYRQVLEFNFINILKDAGCSLEVISQFVKEEKQGDFKNLLNLQLDQLLKEKQKLEQKEETLRESIKQFDLISQYPGDNSCIIEDEKEAYLIRTPIRDIHSKIETSKNVKDHLDYCESIHQNVAYQFTYIYEEDKNGKEHYYVASKIKSKIDSSRFYRKPSGRYMKYLLNDKYNEEKIYNRIKQFANEKGVEVEDTIYESEISIFRGEEENYMIEVSVRIK